MTADLTQLYGNCRVSVWTSPIPTTGVTVTVADQQVFGDITEAVDYIKENLVARVSWDVIIHSPSGDRTLTQDEFNQLIQR